MGTVHVAIIVVIRLWTRFLWEVNLECERFLVADYIESLLQYMWIHHLSYLYIHRHKSHVAFN